MTMTVFPAERLYRVGVVVADLRAAARNYAEIFGIDRWAVAGLGPERLSDTTIRGRAVRPAYRTAVGTTPSGVATFELLEAGPGESTVNILRCTRGQGVHHLTLAVTGEDDARAVTDFLAARGAPVAQTAVVDGTLRLVDFDTRAVLGGYLLRLAVDLDGSHPDGHPAPDEVWDLSGEYRRPDGVEPIEVTQLHHFGVVVTDVVAAVERYADVFGIRTWNFMNWRTEPGRLDNPFYRGAPVDHAYFCGMGFDFREFGFEIIQPTSGPSHYREDFLREVGEGVHHMQLFYPRDAEHWQRVADWLAPLGIPVVMGSTLRGGATTFYYLDTRAALGGWSIEATLRHAGADPAKRVYDFVTTFDRA
jgi:catechol 2,3-dioxygenase-like lactoylglutathione lyase family enzyme